MRRLHFWLRHHGLTPLGRWERRLAREYDAAQERAIARIRADFNDMASKAPKVTIGGVRQEPDEADWMCPNCVTPWKCNGPHLPEPCHERGLRHVIGSEDGGVMTCKVCGTVGGRLA